MPKKKPPQFHLRKKLEIAYSQGFYDGCEETHEVWVDICSRTKGVGPKTQQKLLETARAVVMERYQKKRGGAGAEERA